MKTIKMLLFGLLLTSVQLSQAQAFPFKVEVTGKGNPILFFPGFTCTGDVWEDTVRELSKTHQCHVFTFAGFGDVPAIDTPWLPKIKEGVLRYISEERLNNPSIVGHSLGGALALWMATESDSFEQLVIVDGLPSTGALMMPNFKSEYMVYESPYNKQVLEMNPAEFEAMANQMASGMALNTEKRSKIKEWMLQADRETYVYGYTDLLKLDLREAISKIKVPVTVLAATHPYGYETAKSTYETQFAKLKEYEIHFAQESAHFIMYDQPDWFMEQLKSTL